jgi:hypothetical protein
MNRLETTTINIVALIEKVWVPVGPKGVDRGDMVIVAKTRWERPIFASVENEHTSRRAFSVNMEGTDCPFPTNQGPFSVGLGIWRGKPNLIL